MCILLLSEDSQIASFRISEVFKLKSKETEMYEAVKKEIIFAMSTKVYREQDFSELCLLMFISLELFTFVCYEL